MSKAPGYQRSPNHTIRENHLTQRVTVEIDGQRVADSTDVIRVEEDGHPPRYYFPRGDVQLSLLEPTSTTTQCPFKGTARYFSVHAGGKSGVHLDDAVWTYEEPYDEHQGLKGRLAFYDDKYQNIRVRAQS
ncbi:MAG TPA: DUF427 domain-containing protein [Steroidobacteraceae bacterium]|nr:DUF427 domain-containing protein [Steroidobacteraceae bacterium]